ncbi:M56 family metallopeptidase [Clostridium sp. HBUAS56010]|uniref:M56 family metallopeptidase n=1 Tax=Clostridium sp. HBUAS56010 TaxID=2571127 RepID=UPI0011777D44|nr:M56 family metallopeptidase [Clostridium sp. HBUAS56010]
MTEILISVLNMSIAASIVAVAVMLVRVPLKKAPKIFSYVLWAVVFLRLICPLKFESSASLMPINAEIIPPTVTTTTKPQINSGIVAVDEDEQVNLFMERAMPQADYTASVNPIQIVLSISAYIWLCGLIALVIYAIVGYIRVKRQVYDATIKQDNVFETDKISTAFVLGFIRPKIYLPTIVRNEQLDHILKHEQVHISRKDYLIKPVAFLILTIHWFNPIVWVSYYLMSKDMEMSCDEAVLRKSSEDIHKSYSTSLVALYTPKSKLLSPLAFGEGSYRNKKVRIKNVLNFKKAPKWAIVLCSILSVLFMVGFTTNPPQIATDNLINSNNARVADLTTEYAQWNITISNGVYYYNDTHIRIFLDMRANNSFERAFIDKDGNTDIRLIRDNSGNIVKLELISRDEAIELMKDFDSGSSIERENNKEKGGEIEDVKRLEVAEAPNNIQAAILSSCTGNGFYIIKGNDRQYVYYNNLTGGYAYQVTGSNVKIVDLIRLPKCPILLSLPANLDISLEYNSNTVVYTVIPVQQEETSDKQTIQQEQNIKNQYAIYEPYGLTYRENEDKLYYKDQIVRYFIDKYNNGPGILNMWAYDLDGTIDLHTTRNNVGLQGILTGIEAYSQEDFNLRTKEIEAEKNNIPNYDVLTFRFRKSEAPDSLQLWIKDCESNIFDFATTEQNGRYYIYVRGETEFNFGVKVDGDKAVMEISHINGVKGEGYALFSAPLYKQFTVTYNGTTKSFIQ